jgi:hypothetical protein
MVQRASEPNRFESLPSTTLHSILEYAPHYMYMLNKKKEKKRKKVELRAWRGEIER